MNVISWYYILHPLRDLVKYIIPLFQFTSELYLTNQSYSKNISVLFKSVTAILIFLICLLSLTLIKRIILKQKVSIEVTE